MLFEDRITNIDDFCFKRPITKPDHFRFVFTPIIDLAYTDVVTSSYAITKNFMFTDIKVILLT